MTKPAVLFDLDGTLIYSSDAIRSCISQTLVDFGHEELGPDNIQYFVGVPLGEALLHWTDDPRPMVDHYRKLYMACFEEKTSVYNGIPEMLEAIHGRVLTGIITLKGNPQTRTVLDTFGIGKYFSNIYGDDGPGKAIHPIKPDPRHFFYAFHDMGLITDEEYEALKEIDDLTGKDAPFDNRNILFIGDTDADMRGAIRAGIRPIGVAWGLREKHILLDAGAEQVADDPPHLLRILIELGFL